MAFRETPVIWSNIVRMTNNGLYVADYADIRKAVTQAFKNIYGSDIDTSTGTADGIYIDFYCLMINNILQSFKTTYSNLDVNEANGKYLELLCSLSNVFRKRATKSVAKLEVTYNGTGTYSPESTGTFSVLDENGLTWTHPKNANNLLTWSAGETKPILVECDVYGPQEAPAHSIEKLVNNEVDMTIVQEEQAYVGSIEESDTELRARRNQSQGATGTTVLESLVGALLALPSIKDAKVYVNSTSMAMTAKDNTSLNPHDVYICLRYQDNTLLNPNDYKADIGTVIYNKLTPGILTTLYSGSDDEGVSFECPVVSRTTHLPLSQTGQIVNWKLCKPVHPQIKIALIGNSHFVTSTQSVIKKNLIEYLNSLPIGTDLNPMELAYKIVYYDPGFRGVSTFTVNRVLINDVAATYQNKDTYYHYTESDIIFA